MAHLTQITERESTPFGENELINRLFQDPENFTDEEYDQVEEIVLDVIQEGLGPNIASIGKKSFSQLKAYDRQEDLFELAEGKTHRNETVAHSLRVAIYMIDFMRILYAPSIGNRIMKESIATAAFAALCHDIGKKDTEKRFLYFEGKLEQDSEEMNSIREHVENGIKGIISQIDIIDLPAGELKKIQKILLIIEGHHSASMYPYPQKFVDRVVRATKHQDREEDPRSFRRGAMLMRSMQVSLNLQIIDCMDAAFTRNDRLSQKGYTTPSARFIRAKEVALKMFAQEDSLVLFRKLSECLNVFNNISTGTMIEESTIPMILEIMEERNCNLQEIIESIEEPVLVTSEVKNDRKDIIA